MSDGQMKTPVGWTWTTLGELGSWNGGGTPSKEQARYWVGGAIPWVSPKDMKVLRLLDSEDHVTAEALEETVISLSPVGTVLVVVRSGILQRTLPVAVAQVSVTMNQDMKGIRCADGVEPMYVAYYLVKSQHDILAQCSKDGTTVASIETESLRRYSVPIAPLAEQRRIVNAIEQQFTRLDAGGAALKRTHAALKRYRAAVLKAAVEGRLTEAWRAAHPDAEPASRLLERILAERRAKWEADLRAKGKDPTKAKYTEPGEPDTGNLPDLLEGWCWATVEQLAAPEANAITDGPFGSNLKTEHYRSEGMRVIRLQNIGDGVFNDVEAFISPEHFATLSKHQVYEGDIVIAALGEKPPRSCLIPPTVGPAIVKADCIRFHVSQHAASHYVHWALTAEPTRKRTSNLLHGVGRPRLNLGEIKSIVIPLPPADEQQQIVAEVEQRLSVVDALEAAVETNLKRAGRLRQSILERAFSGQLVPQDPDDEPASELLGRIRAERVASNDAGRNGRNGSGSAAADDASASTAITARQPPLWRHE